MVAPKTIAIEYQAECIAVPDDPLRIASIRRQLRTPLNIPAVALAQINGEPADDATLAQAGDRVDFVVPWGRKGASPKKNYRKLPTAREIFSGSNSARTRTFLRHLEEAGQRGRIAAGLFRSQKASSRAKSYRGGIRNADGSKTSYQELSYERKDKCLEKLCLALKENSCGVRWGWKIDPNESFAKHVLYIDLSNGQVSFHSTKRFVGPDYKGEWDGSHDSEGRVIGFCQSIVDRAVKIEAEREGRFLQGWKPASEATEKDVDESRRAASEVTPIPRQCFFNARRVIERLDRYADASYVEGWAVIGVGAMEHAWIVKDGKIIDPTLPDQSGVYFPGLEFQGRKGIKNFLRTPRGKKCKKTAFLYAFGWGGGDSPSFHKSFEDAMEYVGQFAEGKAESDANR